MLENRTRKTSAGYITISLSLDNQKRVRQTEQLLESTKRLADALNVQQEELRQSNETLKKQAQELSASKEELRAQ